MNKKLYVGGLISKGFLILSSSQQIEHQRDA
jgi:hypothetical protein